MDENIISTEAQMEIGETRDSEQQSLNDATFEPESFVEQTGDYGQSEAVQNDFGTVVDNTIAMQDSSHETSADIPSTAADSISEGQSEETARDPLSGKGGENPENPTGSEGNNEAAIDPAAAGETQTEGISDNEVVGWEAGHIPSSEIDGNDPIYEMDQNSANAGKDINEDTNQSEGPTGAIDPQRIGDEQLPEELKGPGGMGVGVDGNKKPGTFPSSKGGGNKKPGTVPSSKGGVLQTPYGGGTKGKGKEKEPTTESWSLGSSNKGVYEHEQHGRSSNSCAFTISRVKELVSMNKNSTGIVECSNGQVYNIYHKGNLIDGETATPYTGMTGGSGEDFDPDKPIGGLDGDSGKIHPIFGYGGGGSDDDSGGTPGDKDGDDDSGKFLADGTLSGGDGFFDPSDLDYYTPTGHEANARSRQAARGR